MFVVILFLVLSILSSIIVIAAGMLTSRMHRNAVHAEIYGVNEGATDDGIAQNVN